MSTLDSVDGQLACLVANKDTIALRSLYPVGHAGCCIFAYQGGGSQVISLVVVKQSKRLLAI